MKKLVFYILWSAAIILCLVLSGRPYINRTVLFPMIYPESVCQDFEHLYILHAGRICPMQTFVCDFAETLLGDRTEGARGASQMLLGYAFSSKEWENFPLLKIENDELCSLIHVRKKTSVKSLFLEGKYLLDSFLDTTGFSSSGIQNEARKLDEKIKFLQALQELEWLRIFPIQNKEGTIWLTPKELASSSMSPKNYASFAEKFLYEFQRSLRKADESKACYLLRQVSEFQKKYAKKSLPSKWETRAEMLYNEVPFIKGSQLLIGLTIICAFFSLLLGKCLKLHHCLFLKEMLRFLQITAMALSFFMIAITLLLRAWIIGSTPLSGTYETLLFLSSIILLVLFSLWRENGSIVLLGAVLSGLSLLVADIHPFSAQIMPRLPVLNSSLLGIHVLLIISSYALFSFTFICGIIACIQGVFSLSSHYSIDISPLTSLSQKILRPAVFLLVLGVFIGAMWADRSWGSYWSWDPKETWALITLIIYAIPLHIKPSRSFASQMRFHLFMSVAFFVLLMTYFGVNYWLGGLHSYA